MAITFKGITLGRSAPDAFDFPQDARQWPEQSIQETPIIRSDAPFRRQRGNRIYNCTFTIARRHSTLEQAERFGGQHAEACQGEGTFSGLGLLLTRATCVPTTRCMGLVTITDYAVRGIGGAGGNPPDVIAAKADSTLITADSTTVNADAA